MLTNVVVVEGFYVNIISEACLKKLGAWYLSIDCILCSGTLSKNVILMTLRCEHNLVFVEYKLLSIYLSLSTIPLSDTELVLSTTSVQLRRRTKYPLLERDDSEQIWHQRLGYLGLEALRVLAWAARGVKISGMLRIRCEHYVTVHAKQVVL